MTRHISSYESGGVIVSRGLGVRCPLTQAVHRHLGLLHGVLLLVVDYVLPQQEVLARNAFQQAARDVGNRPTQDSLKHVDYVLWKQANV